MPSGDSGVKQTALGGVQGQQQTQAGALSAVSPIYQSWINNPTGYTPQQKANMLTSVAQGAGGSTAGIVGQGALMEGRTGNVGGLDVAIDAAARDSARAQSASNLDVQNQDAQLALKRQFAGLQGEQNIYDTSGQEALGYLGAANQAKPSFWQQLGTTAANTAVRAAAGAAFG